MPREVPRRSEASGEAFRALPSVEEVLQRWDAAAAREGAPPRELAARLVREVLEAWRGEIRAGALDAAGLAARLQEDALERALDARLGVERRAGVVPALNATGVVLHTGLGRAPLHPEVADAMRAAAAGYCVLELDRESGRRNQRDQRLGELAARLTGAEAAIAVNNNAAAVYLVLQTLAWGGREVVVSRGELVEIGGSFRVPDVMQRAGVTLREVGTTNRTHLADYRGAIGPRTALLMKVHTSNFRLQGFVSEVGAAELAELAREHGLASAFDLGSGLVEAPGAAPLTGLGDEPRVREAVESGVDLVTFSGDKLLGGPQAGIVAGRAAAVAELRASPLYRALRLDKVALAGLERTFELLLAGRGDELPARRMLRLEAAELRSRAEALARHLGVLPGVRAEAVEAASQPGSGSAPGVELPSWAARVAHARLSPDELAARLRRAEPPVFGRIHEGALWLDPRTLLEGDEERLLRAFRQAAG